MSLVNILRYFKLNSVRNVIISISVVVLILSLSIPFQSISNEEAQKISFYFLIYGFYLWGLRNWVYDYFDSKKRATTVRMILAGLGFLIVICLAF